MVVASAVGRMVWRSRSSLVAHQQPSTPLVSCRRAINWHNRPRLWIHWQRNAVSTLLANPEATSHRSSRHLRATVVDPGFCKPVHVASVCTHSAAPLDDAEHWHLTEEEWMSASGRTRAQAAERRRRDGTEYGRALESLSGTGRRKSVTAAFVEYMDAMLRTCARPN